jgi:hypothetical protein
MEQEYLIIRNSKSAPSNTNYESSALNTVEEATTFRDDETTSLLVNHDASLSIVTLVESSEGKYMLDFGHDKDDPIVASFLINHTTEQKGDLDDCKNIFIESKSLKYLRAYAGLADIELPMNNASLLNEDSEVQLSCLQYHFQQRSFHLLPDNVLEVIHTLLPLEQLFSWSTLTSAREGGHLHWKDTRNFLAEVKRSIPFIAPAADGLFYHIIQTHLTFHQFVAFAKLVEHHLQRLPIVKLQVFQASTLSVDIQLTSHQNCTVCIGCLLNEDKCPPSAQQLKDCKEIFASWECINLVAEHSTIIRLGGLKEGTVYDSYVHVSRPSSEFPVASTDDDVIHSRYNIETQGYHLINVFPVFDSMTKEEQRTEVFASIKDRAVRLRAQADGLVIPGVQEEADDYDNETWRLYIEWWKDNPDIRYDFCMRELIFASKDKELRRKAQKDGIVMSHGKSKDQAKRERWARAFGLWYHNHQKSTVDSRFQISAETEQYQAHPPVQTLNLSRSEVDESKVGGLRPRFQSKESKAEVKTDGVDEDYADSLGEVLVLQSLTSPQPKVSPPTSPKDFTELSSTTRNEPAPSEPDSHEPITSRPCHPDETEVPQSNAQVSNTWNEEPTIPPKPTKTSRLTIGVVGHRHRFLRRLSTRIDTCLALTRPNKPSSLRGIALFRAKVRLVMLLQKVSNKPFSSLLNDVDIFSYQQRDIRTRSANPAAVTPISEEEEEDDEEEGEEDSVVLMDKAASHCKDRLARNVFRMMRSRAKEVAAEKRAQEENTLAAVETFNSLLLRKGFRTFVEAVRAQKESVEEDTEIEADPIEDANSIEEAAPEPPPVEVEYMYVEDDDSCVFASQWNTGVDTFCRINRSSDIGLLIDPTLLKYGSNRRRITTLDDETLSSLRCAKRAGSSNLYDVPISLLQFDALAEEQTMDCFRNRVVVKNIITTKA